MSPLFTASGSFVNVPAVSAMFTGVAVDGVGVCGLCVYSLRQIYEDHFGIRNKLSKI